jgi:hypothetical protein
MVNSSFNIHSGAYFLTLVLIAVSLPLSKFAMSVSEFALLGMWAWSGFSFRITLRFFKLGGFFSGIYHTLGYLLKLIFRNFVDKFAQFFRNKAAVIFSSIYLILIIGLIYTSDLEYALKDLRIKLPLLLFPVVISTMEKINYRRFRILMLFYIAAVLVGSLIGYSLILKGDFTDIRFTSPYISSIRFGLNVSFAFFTLLYFVIFDQWFKNWHKAIFILLIVWFLIYLVLLESVTSLTVIILISLLYLIYQVFYIKSRLVKTIILFIVIAIPAGTTWYVMNTVKTASTADKIIPEQLDSLTADGNPYVHDTLVRGIEDGQYVGLYLCEPELEKAWNKRSTIKYNDFSNGEHEIKETLIRYLTSKGLRKDRVGVESLTENDIHLIEQGVANYNYIHNPGLRVRILKIMMGYEVFKKTGDPSGSSVMQRLEYLKASIKLIKKHFWTGVGTGDIEDVLYDQYEEMNSELKAEFMFHAHNQFLTFFITFGIFGFIWFIVALIYPPILQGRFSDYFFATFFIIMVWSMLSDDTLDTQAGVTLFAFFTTFLMFGKEKKNART